MSEPLPRLYWSWLVAQISADDTAATLSAADRHYFAIRMLVFEVCNGGFCQYFFNASSDYFSDAVDGLDKIGALSAKSILMEVAHATYGDVVPSDQNERDNIQQKAYDMCPSLEDTTALLEQRFYSMTDAVEALLQRYAEEQNLFARFSAA